MATYDDLTVYASNTKLVTQELCNYLPKLYGTLQQHAKCAGVAADVGKGAKTVLEKAMLIMATCTALQVLQRQGPMEADRFQKERLPQYKVKTSSLQLHVQEALQTLALDGSG